MKRTVNIFMCWVSYWVFSNSVTYLSFLFLKSVLWLTFISCTLLITRNKFNRQLGEYECSRVEIALTGDPKTYFSIAPLLINMLPNKMYIKILFKFFCIIIGCPVSLCTEVLVGNMRVYIYMHVSIHILYICVYINIHIHIHVYNAHTNTQNHL